MAKPLSTGNPEHGTGTRELLSTPPTLPFGRGGLRCGRVNERTHTLHERIVALEVSTSHIFLPVASRRARHCIIHPKRRHLLLAKEGNFRKLGKPSFVHLKPGRLPRNLWIRPIPLHAFSLKEFRRRFFPGLCCLSVTKDKFACIRPSASRLRVQILLLSKSTPSMIWLL